MHGVKVVRRQGTDEGDFHYVKDFGWYKSSWKSFIQSSVLKSWAGRPDQKVLLSFHMGYIRTWQKQMREGKRG